MTILYLLIPLSLILLGLAVWAFFWAVKNDQFDDLEGPAHRILFDDDENDLTPEQRAEFALLVHQSKLVVQAPEAAGVVLAL